MTGPQTVEVIVRGRLGPDLVAALSDYSIEVTPDGWTSITGQVCDQARLIGLLGMLDELHIEVVSVNFVDDPEGS